MALTAQSGHWQAHQLPGRAIDVPQQSYDYVLVGGGLAGGYAVEGIRAHDQSGSILLVGNEMHLPYERPPLSKKLWTGKKQLPDLFPHERDYYERAGVQLQLGTVITSLDAERKAIVTATGQEYGYGKLLLATGGIPRHLPIPGGDSGGINYYRYLDDYFRLRSEAQAGKKAVVIGGGFIGSEVAAALNMHQVEVTLLFPGEHLCGRLFPAGLGQAIDDLYRAKGVHLLARDGATAIGRGGGGYVVRTRSGQELAADMVVVGIGIMPDIALAEGAGLHMGDGIEVNELLRTSRPDIFAAGDNARFPYVALGDRRRVEHWDNAVMMGKWAGENMAGAGRVYDHMPYFFSDLFEFGYEAVGDVDSRLETFADWKKENDTGVIYYLKGGKLRGAMMCNVWDKVPVARDLIRQARTVTAEDLRGAIG
jgi:3-phenylpropionate/trans-cinnamate dioxygenase ferredoxin reductase component